MTAWEVYQKDTLCYVKGLKVYDGSDKMLFHRTDYGEPSCPDSGDKMLGALYDLYQIREEIKEGDTFTTSFGVFECVGVHVLPIEEATEYKQRRANSNAAEFRRIMLALDDVSQHLEIIEFCQNTAPLINESARADLKRAAYFMREAAAQTTMKDVCDRLHSSLAELSLFIKMQEDL